MSSIVTSRKFQELLSYTEATVPWQNPEDCKQISLNITKFISTTLVPVYSTFSMDGKKQIKTILNNLQVINDKHIKDGCGRLFDQAIQQLSSLDNSYSPQVSIQSSIPLALQEAALLKLHSSILLLDQSSPDFIKNVRCVRQMIKEIQINHPDLLLKLKNLEDAINSLLFPKTFDVDYIETLVLTNLKDKLPICKNSYTELAIQTSLENARKNLLLKLKETSPNSLLKLCDCLPQEISLLKQAARQERLISLDPTSNLPVSLTTKNLLILIEQTQQFAEEMTSITNKKIVDIHSRYDRISNGKFSALIQNYKTLNLSMFIPKMLDDHLDAFWRVRKDDISNSIPKVNSTTFENGIKTLRVNYLTAVEPNLGKKIHELRQNEYNFFVKNIDNLVKPYSQQDDIHRNQNTGTCLENSMERQTLLLQNPTLSSKQIEMHSSKEGRFSKAMRRFPAEEKNNMQRLLKRLNISKSIYKGIKAPEDSPVSSKQYVINFLFEQHADEINKQYQGLFILGLKKDEKDPGHVLNIQYDLHNQIYRVLDDNTGIWEYHSPEEFKTKFQSYLEIFYPDCQIIGARFVTLLK